MENVVLRTTRYSGRSKDVQAGEFLASYNNLHCLGIENYHTLWLNQAACGSFALHLGKKCVGVLAAWNSFFSDLLYILCWKLKIKIQYLLLRETVCTHHIHKD